MSETTPFYVDRAKGGRASCKGCKTNCPSGELRLAKVVPSPYGDNQQMKSWFHVDCFVNALLKQRPATKRVDSIDDIGNWESLTKNDQELILKKLNEMEKLYAEKNSGKYTAKRITNESNTSKNVDENINQQILEDKLPEVNHDDNKFSMLYKLCKKISKVDAYTEKTAVVSNFFKRGTDNVLFKGDLALWCKLLLPQVSKRVYNLKSKQLVKLFSKIFNTDHDDMLTHLEQGDIADTIQFFFSKSRMVRPCDDSTLTIHNVEDFLEELSKLTREEEQIYQFKKIVKKCTLDDMRMLIRLIKGDLRINAGPKHILEGVHPDAYNIFQTSRDLNMVLDRVLSENSSITAKNVTKRSVEAKLSLMTPVLPMLAEACKSVDMAMKKCPNGMFSEIKYDGERVQVHKKDNEFKYFSRALKPVMAHKVRHFKDYLPQAFPKGVDLILDAEVLMVDVNTGKPLPFGTLGVHKQSEFKDAQVCLFVFDCLFYNGQVLTDLPIRKRRKILEENMVEVKNHVMFSEQELIEKPADLAKMIAEVLELGLEGLVLKDLESTYEPGKRHWLKVKKDYLFDGAMADTADLVVLGAWFGTGKKGGMMSVFLMGCLDNHRNRWVTVTKVHTGHDDNTLERLQKELAPLMLKISQDYNKVPFWLHCNKGLVPDFVALDPKNQPVWEITGTELTKANLHTADGISVRFPRVTRIRTDKDWQTATNLEELRNIYKTSKEKTDVTLLNKLAASVSDSVGSPVKKKAKLSPRTNKLDSFLVKRESNDKTQFKSPSKLRNNNEYSSDDESESPQKNMSSNSSRSSCNISFDENDSSVKSEDTKTDKLDRPPSGKKRKLDMESPSSAKRIKLEKESTSSEKKIKLEMESPTSVKTIELETERPTSGKKRKLDQESINSGKKRKLENESPNSSTIDIEHSPAKKENRILLPENPLPDVFKDKKLGFYPDFISFSEYERRHFERHWIAYGGVVVKSLRSSDVDYVVHSKKCIDFKNMQKLKDKYGCNVKHVNKSWLIKCINDVTLCDTKKFVVFVEP